VTPSFFNGFLETSIESLRLSVEKEVNGIIGREELINRLMEKKIYLEKLLQNESFGNPIELSSGSSNRGHGLNVETNLFEEPTQQFNGTKQQARPVSFEEKQSHMPADVISILNVTACPQLPQTVISPNSFHASSCLEDT
ncbi:uncharacterized protein LOC128729901, partial [Anopheles nili]|uniref:uncharacterized protein LOC128729901 n=1 Tax=Anopheles nili TaxID=185578 RepID=UPI00237A3650